MLAGWGINVLLPITCTKDDRSTIAEFGTSDPLAAILLLAAVNFITMIELEKQMQRLLELASGWKMFKASYVSHFDTADVIVSEPYGLQIDGKGSLTEMVLYFRILNEGKRVYGLTLYEMPLNTGEKYQEPLRVQNKNYFERTIHNLPFVLAILKDLNYVFDNVERYVG